MSPAFPRLSATALGLALLASTALAQTDPLAKAAAEPGAQVTPTGLVFRSLKEGTGAAPQRMGLAHPSICPYGAFALKDGSLVLISIQNEREWTNFCRVVTDDADLPSKPGYESNTIRVANRTHVDGHVGSVFATLGREEAEHRREQPRSRRNEGGTSGGGSDWSSAGGASSPDSADPRRSPRA